MDFKFKNEFAAFPVSMRLVDDFAEGLPLIKSDLNGLKTTMEPFGWYYLPNLMYMHPTIIQYPLASDWAAKLTLGFSNVPGPKEPWVFCGSRAIAAGFNIPLIKTIGAGWGVLSCGNVFKVGFGGDQSAVPDVHWVMSQFEKNLHNCLNQ